MAKGQINSNSNSIVLESTSRKIMCFLEKDQMNLMWKVQIGSCRLCFSWHIAGSRL